ncbi:MAG: DEAD/DEAH box helicase [Dermatophilaceae bacterium]
MPAYLIDVLSGLGIHHPTPIQTATVPDALAARDVLGRGRTGSGKTYAFLLPLVARLADRPRARPTAPRALIMAPTRELVSQIDTALAPLARAGGLSTRTVVGGVGQHPQVTALRRGVDVVVATPGRLEDLIAQGHCTLGDVEITVLDEADHMCDLGFLPAMRRLLSQTPRGSQRLFFSATLDQAVNQLVRQHLIDPVKHEVEPASSSSEGTMVHHVLHIEREHRLAILVALTSAPDRTMVFTRTKRGAKALARQLSLSGVPAVELHGNLGQSARTRNLDAFHTGRASTLVATDIAARGIHVDDVRLVVHADPPTEHKAYLHRSGRTARAGSSGTVVTLATAEQARDVRGLTRAAGIVPTTTRIQDHGHPLLLQLAPGERMPLRSRQSDPPPPASARRPKPASERSSSRNGQQKPHSDAARRRAATARGATAGGQASKKDRPARRTTGGRQQGASAGGRHSAATFSAGRR